ncbi:hypothetical protein BASA81_012909 [Batrachochytrium salamandrivorans]|nr:hypothetical protein BASA81_012909 [Batrachochytrium salamandrivorans]
MENNGHDESMEEEDHQLREEDEESVEEDHEELMEEEHDSEEEDEDEEDEEEEGEEEEGEEDAEVEEQINTFLEFTGSDDRERARQFILGTENMEEALNLFLTGASPPPRQHHDQQQHHEQQHLLDASSFLAQLESLANADRGGVGALLAELNENGDMPFGLFARSLLTAGGGGGGGGGNGEGPGGAFGDFLRAHMSPPPAAAEMPDDDAMYDSMSDSELRSRMDALARGHVDSVSLIGTHVFYSMERFTKFYPKLVSSLCSALNRVSSTDPAIRVLQLLETCLLAMAGGMDQAEFQSIGWFLAPRRIGVSKRARAQARAKLVLDQFTSAVRGNDLAAMRRMLRRGDLEIDGVVELAKEHNASAECLDLLVRKPSVFPLSGDELSTPPEFPLWQDVTLALLRFVAKSSSGSALHRALEMVLLVIKQCPEHDRLAKDFAEAFVQLLTAMSLGSNRNPQVLQPLAVEMISRLLSSADGRVLVDLARNGTLSRLQVAESSAMGVRVASLGHVLNGRPAWLESIADLGKLTDITAFEYEQSEVAQKLLKSGCGASELAQISSSRKHGDGQQSDREEEEEEEWGSDLSFYFGKSKAKTPAAVASLPTCLSEHLIACAQSVISEAQLPQIAHDFPEDLGVRVLLSTFLLRLHSKQQQMRGGLQVGEFALHALPLTPKKELDRQVLRCSTLMDDARYVAYCHELVGRKLVLEECPGEVFVCTKFNSTVGVHRLRTSQTKQHWRVLALAKYVALERVFESGDEEEIAKHDDSELDLAEGSGAMLMQASAPALNKTPSTDVVCVWWEGGENIRPGWRLATVCGDGDREQVAGDQALVQFPLHTGLVFDSEIRVGSLCREVASTEFAKVSAVMGKTCTLANGGSKPVAVEALIKIGDYLDDYVRPNMGDSVGVLKNGHQVEFGVLLADEMSSRLPFTVQLHSNEIEQFADSCVFAVSSDAERRFQVNKNQICTVEHLDRVSQEHLYSVYIRPQNMPEPRLDFTRVPLAAGSSAAAAAAGGEEDEGRQSPVPSEPPSFRLGDKIEGQYLGKSRWYRGSISRVNVDGTYDLHYLDGDMERCVARQHVRLAEELGSNAEEDASSSSSLAPSYDFRKAFPAQAGKSLFDALRRDDAILSNEYNFVTRGFEHQPNFYQSFSSTLERFGAGVFAQFQNLAQASTLFARCLNCEVDSAYIRFEPERKPPASVLREICSAFSKDDVSQMPPKPGSRCLVRIGPHAKPRALAQGSEINAWVSATMVSLCAAAQDGGEHASVVTDEGVYYFRVPMDHLKEAPTVPPSSNPLAPKSSSAPNGNNTPQRNRLLRFGAARLQTPPQQPPSAPPSRLDTPIELSRQFSVFGSSNSLRYLSVDGSDSALVSPASGRSRNKFSGLPEFLVEFEPHGEQRAMDVVDGGIALVDEEVGEEASLFRFLFQHFFAHEPVRRQVLIARWAAKPLQLAWKVRIRFPGDPPFSAGSSPSSKEQELAPGITASLRLLHKLHDDEHDATISNSGAWVNAPLSHQFKQALRDPLSVATRTLPRWMQTLPHSAPFLFQERDRVQFLKSVTIGVSRSITYLQEEVTGYSLKKRELAQATLELSQFFKEAQPNDAKVKRLTATCDKLEDDIKQLKDTRFIGQLRQDLVKVDPHKNLLRDAMKLMEQHVGERSELIVQFVGENVSGEGVTNEFYGAVGAELSRAEQQLQVPMWASCPPFLGGEYLNPALGLFPQPLLANPTATGGGLEQNQRVVERFRFLGRLFAQAFLDEKQIPIPIAVEFFELLKRESPNVKQVLHCIEGEEGGNVCALYDLVQTAAKDKHNAAIAQRLEEAELKFVDPAQRLLQVGSTTSQQQQPCFGRQFEIVPDNVPGPAASFQTVLTFAQSEVDAGRTKAEVELALESVGHSKVARFRVMKAVIASSSISLDLLDENRNDPQAELVPGGRNQLVTVSNVKEYLDLVIRHWTDTGIVQQVQNCRLGLQDILGTTGTATLLDFFSAEDLVRMFCGEQEMKLDENDALLGFLVPKGEYSANSREICMLVECLKLMTSKERSSFLSFCTALPRVPLSGLPQIKVFPPPKCRVAALVVQLVDEGDNADGWKSDKSTWFLNGDKLLQTNGGMHGQVASWDAQANTVYLKDNSTNNREFRKGNILLRQGGGEFVVKHCVEQCEVVQSPPFFRPKATTCVTTLYLPTGYENAEHMLHVFREAFEDAKLGGLQDV